MKLQYQKLINKNWIPWILLAVLSLIWGSSFILIKKGLEVFPPIQLAMLRIGISAIVFIPFMAKAIKQLTKKQLLPIMAMAVFGNGIPAFLFALAQTNLDSGFTGALNSMTPLFVLVFGILFFGRRLIWMQIFGIIIGFVGAFLLIYNSNTFEGSLHYWYALLVIFATICYGLSSNIIKEYLQDIPPITSGAIAFLMIGPFAIVYLYISDFVPILQNQEGAWFAFGYLALLAIFGTVLGTIWYIKLVQLTNAVFGSMITYLIPFVAIVWGIFDKEIVSYWHFIGLGLILFGVYVVSKGRNKQVK